MKIDPVGETASPSSREHGDALAPGEQIGKYRLDRVLGQGGMGVVWAAHDPDLDRAVAIKVLRGAASSALRARLLREARAMAKIRHPNVLTVYEAASDGGRDYIAMELVDGTDLERWLASSPSRPQVWEALLAAGRGLAAAHAAGLVHRDFKPHNVMRGHTGQIVVTDFGLARDVSGAGDSAPLVGLEDTLDSADRGSSLLVSRLTDDGALIGTPAYMAPEQLAGAAADARGDQFAFCVTAWQALAGKRPFAGATLDELRGAVAAGPAGIDADLPRPVRAVLERGLDPARDRRWPDMEQLLAALVRAGGPRRWTKLATRAAVAAAAAAIAAVVAVRATRPSSPRVPARCSAAQATFDHVWPTGGPTALARLRGTPAFERFAHTFDDYRSRWLAAHASACAIPDDTQLDRRLACFGAQLDQLEGVTVMLGRSGPGALDGLDPEQVLPRLEECTGATPMALPRMPPDPSYRASVLDLYATLLEVETARPDQSIDAQVSTLLGATSWGTWDPLNAEILEVTGRVARARGQVEVARERLQRAATLADSTGADRIGARARIELVEVEGEVASDPSANEAIDRMITEARAAVHRAGDAPDMIARLDLVEAGVRFARGEGPGVTQPAADAFGITIRNGDLDRATVGAALMIAGMWPSAPRPALDAAGSSVRSIEVQAAQRHLAPSPALDRAAADLAWIRGDLDTAHRRLDHAAGARPGAAGSLVTGRVVGPDGAPAAGAVVVTWTGELDGDGRRLFTDPSTFTGEVATADPDGRFTLHVAAGGAILAELGDLRSVPRAVSPAGAISIALAPTRTATGTFGGDAPARFDAFVRFAAGTAVWYVRAPVIGEGFRIDRVPAGGVLGVSSTVGRWSTRRVLAAPASTAVPWPDGLALDVIYREGSAWHPRDHAPGPHERAEVWVFRGKVAPRTRADVEALALVRDDVASAPLAPIGAETTDEGRRLYRRHDTHAIFRGTHEGLVTTCVTIDPTPNASARCATFTVPADPSSLAQVFEQMPASPTRAP